MNRSNFITGALCALVLLVSGCAATSTDRSTGQAIDDTAIEAKAKAALIENPSTKAYDIDLEVFKGEVQLNGFVETAAEKQAAAATVQQVAGVKSVRNNLQVQPQDRSGEEVVDDSMITAKVKTALIEDSRTKAYQIEVTTNNGRVQLGGYVDSSAAKSAAGEVAKAVEGVKSVSNLLSVKG
jgi:hyperosmotically inducible protein